MYSLYGIGYSTIAIHRFSTEQIFGRFRETPSKTSVTVFTFSKLKISTSLKVNSTAGVWVPWKFFETFRTAILRNTSGRLLLNNKHKGHLTGVLRGILPSINRDFSPFHVIDLFLYPLKTLANRMFSYVFMGYRKRRAAWNGLTASYISYPIPCYVKNLSRWRPVSSLKMIRIR